MNKDKAKRETMELNKTEQNASDDATSVAAREKAAAEKAAAKEKAAAEKVAEKAARKLKKRQESLHLSDSKVRDFVDANSAGIGFHEAVGNDDGDIVDYRILDINPAFEAVLAVEAATVVGGLGSQIYGKGRAPFLADIAAAVESGEAASIEGTVKTTRTRLGISIQPMGNKRFALTISDVSEDLKARRRRNFLETRIKTVSAERNEIMATLNARIAELEPQVKTLTKNLAASEKNLAASEKQLSESNAAIARKETALNQEQDKRKKLQADLAAASEARDRLKEVLGDLNNAVKDG